MRDLFESELVTLEELLKDLKCVVFLVGADFWVRNNDSSIIYSVRSAY